MKRKRWLVALVLIGAVSGGAWWLAHRSAQGAGTQETKVVAVDCGEVRSVVNASGRISPNFEVDIKCKASGAVVNLPFDVSDFVNKGDLVLQLDPINEQRLVKQQEAALAGSNLRLSKAQQALQIAEQTLVTDTRQAEISLRTAEITARDLRNKSNRAKQLLEQQIMSMEEYESSETSALRAEAAVEDARNFIEALKTRPISIEQLRNEVLLAKLSIQTVENDLRDAQQRLEETRVYAPISGVVTTRPAQIGTIVSSGITNVGGGTSVMTLADLSRLFVLAPVNEADIGRVKLGQNTVVRCDAYPDRSFEGKIIRISAKGVTTASVVSFEVKMEIVGEGREFLRPEMSTDIEIIVAHREKVLRLPTEAVLFREKTRKRYVQLAVGTSTTQPAAPATAQATTTAPSTAPATVERDIEVGIDDGSFCEVVSGLREGDKVVVPVESQASWSNLKLNR
jgi:HlyD family secretion protein